MKRHIIQFQVFKGEKYFIAQGIDLPVVTQGLTLDELAKNLKEAVELHLEGEDLNQYGLADPPTILMNYGLDLSSPSAHAA